VTQKAFPVAASPSTSASQDSCCQISNDTERLQHINRIRKAPAGAQIKRVIDLLLEVTIEFSITVVLIPF